MLMTLFTWVLAQSRFVRDVIVEARALQRRLHAAHPGLLGSE
jgi:hypothetical protein